MVLPILLIQMAYPLTGPVLLPCPLLSNRAMVMDMRILLTIQLALVHFSNLFQALCIGTMAGSILWIWLCGWFNSFTFSTYVPDFREMEM